MEKAYQNGVRDAKPTIVPFNAAFAACTCGFDQSKDAVRTLLTAVEDMNRLKLVPGEYTFATILRGISLNVPEGERRNGLMTSVFRQCCEDGYVSTDVVDAMSRVPVVLSNYLPDLERIPKEWRRNVR